MTPTPASPTTATATNRTVVHDTFVIERSYPASVARVFSAWSDPALKAKWFGDPDFETLPYELDFRVGGRERTGGRPGPDGPLFTYDAVYQDIVQGQRIVYTYEMRMDDKRISVSVVSIEFLPSADGTTLVFTEHGAYLDGLDTSWAREQGTHEILDALGRALSSA